MQRTTLLIAVAVSLTAIPGAFAGWSAHGAIEPDYLPDVDAGLMYADPDTSSADGNRQVYFNVVQEPFWTGVNPNTGALGGHFLTPMFNAPMGFLGVWKDCNQDGYVGAAETALLEYSTALLSDDSVCPAGGLFNDDGWVVEFVWIVDGAARNASALPYRYINDTGVKAWGDSGLPPASPPTSGGGDGGCYVNPPRGTFSSTGAMLDFADCNTGHSVARTATELDEGTYCAEAGANEACSPAALNLGIGFGDEVDNPQCSDSLLNQRIGLWVASPECPDHFAGYVGLLQNYEGQEHATFGAWDCSDAQHVVVANPADANAAPLVDTYTPGNVAPRVGETPGSVYEGVNATYAHCDSDVRAPSATAEQDVEQADAKVTDQYVFTFARSFTACTAVNAPSPVGRQGIPPNTPVSDAFGCVRTNPGGPSNFGVRAPLLGGYAGVYEGPAYFSGSSTLVTPPFPTVETRDDTGVDGASAYYWTFYAHVTAPGLMLPGGSGVYGAEWCGSDFSSDRVVGGYDCNAGHWYNPLYGASAMPTSGGRPVAAIPGQAYNLRDIDCFDGSVAGKYAPGVGLGLTLLDAQADEGTPVGPCYTP